MMMTSKIEGQKRGGASNLTNAGKGRPKGTPNKNTQALKDMILTALGKAGGVEYLVGQAATNPTAFMTLVGKVLPLDVNASHDGKIIAEVVFKGLNG